jgi:protein disulfide-isomerase A6
MMSKLFVVALAVVLAAVMATAEVVKLTDANFDSIVLDSNKDVFVKFFAPWCGHCVRMAGAWEDLSKQMPNVVIAELDVTGNNAAGQRHGVRGFPTLKLFPKNDKQGKNYQGARDVKSFKAFLEANL